MFVIKPAAFIDVNASTTAPRPARLREAARVYPLAPLRQRLLFVTSEMSDFVQVGGLGAVSASLPRALRRYGDVRVMLPGYRQVLDRARAIDVVARLPGLGAVPPARSA